MPALEANYYEIAVGVAQFAPQRDGVWYQKGLPHLLVLRSATLQVGATGPLTDTLRWRAGYKYLGKYSSSAEAVSDSNYSQAARRCIAPCEPVQHFYGMGSVHALYATADPEWRFDGYTVSLEIGPTLYRPTWVEEVPDWRPCEGAHTVCERQAIAVRHDPKLQLGGVVGVGVRVDRATLRAGIWFTEAGGDLYPAIYDCCALDISLAVEF